MFPLQRHRNLRVSRSIRSLVRESKVSIDDLVVPLFICEGVNKKEEIDSMPNYYRISIDLLEKEVEEIWNLGIKAVLLFVKVDDAFKDNSGKEAINPDGLMPKAIKTIKNFCPDLIVMTDVALDPFSSDGHDGIVRNGKIINDDTIDILAQMSLIHAECGADIIAPSDMMDGRVLKIRQILEKNRFHDVGIMSYSAKYASNLYGPFRDALDSAPGFGDKKTYQMDFANKKEALKEAISDIKEGADIILIKPGIPYLDVTSYIANNVCVPIAVYHVSGEYSMIKAAAQKGWIDEMAVCFEQLSAFKRAGAKIIITYFAKSIAKNLNDFY